MMINNRCIFIIKGIHYKCPLEDPFIYSALREEWCLTLLCTFFPDKSCLRLKKIDPSPDNRFLITLYTPCYLFWGFCRKIAKIQYTFNN